MVVLAQMRKRIMGISQKTAVDGEKGREDRTGRWGRHKEHRGKMVRMAQQRAENSEDGTADSTGWWRQHRGHKWIVGMAQRKDG